MEWALFVGAVVVAALLAWRAGFASFWAQEPSDYAKGGEVFDIKKHLNGPMTCHGVIYGPMGRVVSRFSATMDAVWDGDRCRMEETFTYDTGNTQDRVWDLQLAGSKVLATATDLNGEGDLTGDALRMRYAFQMPKESGGHLLNVRDWMYLVQDGTIVNRSQFRKFGITVAELVATIHPVRS